MVSREVLRNLEAFRGTLSIDDETKCMRERQISNGQRIDINKRGERETNEEPYSNSVMDNGGYAVRIAAAAGRAGG